MVTDSQVIHIHPGTGARDAAPDHPPPGAQPTADPGRRARPALRSAGAAVGQRSLRPGRRQTPAPSMMLDDGEIERRGLPDPADGAALCAAAYDGRKPLGGSRSRSPSQRHGRPSLPTSRNFSDSTIHIVAGLLLPIWKRLPDESTRVYRLPDRCRRAHHRPPRLAGLGCERHTDRGEHVERRNMLSPRYWRAPRSSIWPRASSFAAPASMSAYRLELTRLRRGRCASGCGPMACSARSSPGSCASSCRRRRHGTCACSPNCSALFRWLRISERETARDVT